MVATLVLTLVLLVGAGALRHASLQGRRRLAELTGLGTSCIADLIDEAESVRSELGAGALRRQSKLAGVGRVPDHSVLGPLSGRPVLWFDAKVVLHFWKDHYSTDKHGNQQHRRTQHKKTVSEQRSTAGRFVLEDATGKLEVDLAGAKVDRPRQTMDQMRATPPGGGDGVQRAGSSTIGYQHVEQALLPDEPLFVTGVLRFQPVTGVLELAGDDAHPLLVSTRTEDDLRASRARTATGQTVGAVALAIAGVVALTTGTISAVTDPDPAVPSSAISPERPVPAVPEPAPLPVAPPQADGPPAADEPAAQDAPLAFTMPDLTGLDLQSAQDTVQQLGVFLSVSHDLLGSRTQVLDSNWQVCEQVPSAGTPVTGTDAELSGTIDFGVVRREETCP